MSQQHFHEDAGQCHAPFPCLGKPGLSVTSESRDQHITSNGLGTVNLNNHYGHNVTIWNSPVQAPQGANYSVHSSSAVKTANVPKTRIGGWTVRITLYLILLFCTLLLGRVDAWEKALLQIPNPRCVAWKTVFRLFVSEQLRAFPGTVLFTVITTFYIHAFLVAADSLYAACNGVEKQTVEPMDDTDILRPTLPRDGPASDLRPTPAGANPAKPSGHSSHHHYARDALLERPFSSPYRRRRVVPLTQGSCSMGNTGPFPSSAGPSISTRTPPVYSCGQSQVDSDIESETHNAGAQTSRARSAKRRSQYRH